MKEEKWFPAYLYYSANWHKFLVEAVAPFVGLAFRNNLAKGYFYIRYWEKGPHVRLRFKGDESILEHELKPALNEHFNSYFEKTPSIRIDNDMIKSLPDDQKWFPNNSIQYIEYKPEFERYGGKIGIRIAERQFEASSNACLKILSTGNYNDYDETGIRALGAAIHLHLALCYSFGIRFEKLPKIFNMIMQSWLPASMAIAFGINLEKLNIQEITKYKDTTIQIFENEYSRLKNEIVPLHNQLYKAFENDIKFEDEWLNIWLLDTKNIYLDLKNAIRNGEIEIPVWYQNNVAAENITDEEKVLLFLLPSYIHMTNNRVGVLNHNEAFIAFLIKKSVESLIR